jgi:hypothetical protein
LIRILGSAQNLVIEAVVSPAPLVRVRDGQRLLIEIPANGARMDQNEILLAPV